MSAQAGAPIVAERLASFSVAGVPGYGLVAKDGMIVLSRRFADRWPSLREVVAERGFDRLLDYAVGRVADLAPGGWDWEIPVPAPEKILCVGVNYPDRNEEYKDGQDAQLIPGPSRAMTGHCCGRQKARNSTMRVKSPS